MNPRHRILIIFMALLVGMFFVVSIAGAAIPIAEISSFKGEVILLSGNKFIDVKIGRPLINGDKIQTGKGEVEITFDDGALMTVREFSSSMIQQKEEQTGWWVFKTKKIARRMTCLVGRLWFKSGRSIQDNYLQTPTAVCGIRGSEGEWAYDLVNGYLNLMGGSVTILGAVIQGPIPEPAGGWPAIAQGSAQYTAVMNADKAAQDAAKPGAADQDKKKAEDAIKNAIVETMAVMLKNQYLPEAELDDIKNAIKEQMPGLDIDKIAPPGAVKIEVEERPGPDTENPGSELYREEEREEIVSPGD